jgi:hypothetical protein
MPKYLPTYEINIPFSITGGDVVWVIFGVTMILFAVVTFMLFYHWTKYSYNRAVITQASIIYSVVSFVIVLALLGFTLSF